MLDYCKTVNFNRNARRLEAAQSAMFDSGTASSSNLPDEIDGDDRLGVSQRSTKTISKRSSHLNGEEAQYSVNESMFIEGGFGDDSQELSGAERMRRYSVIGNDHSFKQYTKNHDYNTIKYQETRKEGEDLDESVLEVCLKDLA